MAEFQVSQLAETISEKIQSNAREAMASINGAVGSVSAAFSQQSAALNAVAERIGGSFRYFCKSYTI